MEEIRPPSSNEQATTHANSHHVTRASKIPSRTLFYDSQVWKNDSGQTPSRALFYDSPILKDKGGQMNSTAWYPGHPGRGVFNDAAVSQSVPTVVILIDLSPSSQNSQTRRWNFLKSHLYASPLWSWIVLLDCFFKWSGNAKRAQILRVEVTWDGNHLEKIIFTVLRWPEMGTHWVLAIVICIVCKMFCLFRCASISCFQVVSESVSQSVTAFFQIFSLYSL